MSFKRRLWSGGWTGLQVALWYAAAEYVSLVMVLFAHPYRVMLTEQWRGTVALFLVYAILGILTVGLSRIAENRLSKQMGLR